MMVSAQTAAFFASRRQQQQALGSSTRATSTTTITTATDDTLVNDNSVASTTSEPSSNDISTSTSVHNATPSNAPSPRAARHHASDSIDSASTSRRPSLSSFPPSSGAGRDDTPSPLPPHAPPRRPPPVPSLPASYANSVAAMAADPDGSSNQSTKAPSSPSATDLGPSPHSSLSPRTSHAQTSQGRLRRQRPRRLRSQYPRGSGENHVEYILAASFDVDKGPSMEHQFPTAITGEGNMLAELMMPDQTHLRNQDWTVFFLHKDITQDEEERERLAAEERRARRRQRREAGREAQAARAAGQRKKQQMERDDDNALFGGSANGKGQTAMHKGSGGGHDGSVDGSGVDDDLDDGEDESSSSDEEASGSEGAPLIYVLNLVNTKKDATKKRGVEVKSMAICTRHPFLHIYKPLLLLALEEYFKAPVPETLALLYDAVNAMDLSLMPRLSLLERHLLLASDNKDLFVEKFELMIQRRIAEEGSSAVGNGYGPEGAADAIDAAIQRSPPVKPPAEILRSGTKAHLEGQAAAYAVPRDTHEFETKVLYKGIPVPVKVPVAIMPENVGDFSLIKLIQTFAEPHAKAPQPFPLHAHLTTNGPLTHPIIVLVNALLTQKRVLFLGSGMPSGDVAEAVLAACALASGGVLRGFTRHAFPYTDLTKIEDLLQVPGFIAGVTNPAFHLHPEWWDLLCDIPSGRITISSKLAEVPATEGVASFKQQYPTYANLVGTPTTTSTSTANNDLTGDNAFMADILKSVAARLGERVIRAKWRDWVVKFTRIAAAFEETIYGASVLAMGAKDSDGGGGGGANGPGHGHGYVWADDSTKQRELAGNVTRVEGWRNTRSYQNFIQDVAQQYMARPLKGLDLHHMHDRLRTQRLSVVQSRDVFLAFARSVHSYDEICLLLSVAPEAHGGLFYVALGLLHRDRDVRAYTADLLERVAAHDAGKHWWRALSRFEKLAFTRVRREAEAELRNRLEQDSSGSASVGGVIGGAFLPGRSGGRTGTLTPSGSGSNTAAMTMVTAGGGVGHRGS